MHELTVCNESLKATVNKIIKSNLKMSVSPSLSPSNNHLKTGNLNPFKKRTSQQFPDNILDLKEPKGDLSLDSTKFQKTPFPLMNITKDNSLSISNYGNLKEKSFVPGPIKEDKLE